MKKLISLFFLLIMSFSGATVLSAQEPILKFNSNKKFKIVQFTDIHWVPGNEKSNEAKQCMNEILDAEKPDLVIYTGDLVFGAPAETALREALEPVVLRGIPFSVVFGNHDDEHDMTRSEIYQYLCKQPGNLTGTVEGLSGVSNYILPVKSVDGEQTAALVYCLDSHSYSSLKEVEGYDWIKRDQVNWYATKSRVFTEENGGIPLPALAFFHIPLPEYNQAAGTESAALIGSRLEKACAPELNTGLFTAMLEAKDVMGVFVGHDHVNDYLTRWKGIILGYGRFTGGDTVYNGLPGGNGGRVIELTEGKRGFKTWIRLKNNVVINEVIVPDGQEE
ncbi:metallophosphoesterase family protein [Parabacteroides sp. PF5-9]|uniref:metallophosphoesterase family protein n=1 Tax=Parabacteroides sp. PF5-9 TaxID=1742404 RepID=UPI002475350F|nr:metallophosphoesterase family protein [Parabacteroides sp. PF5-9]MDH6357859.1 3',5'-cyclic AMP phosphodiesterase CpdA [Parabacteroides sp. PF5-9]